MSQDFRIRHINKEDAEATLNIYAPYVQNTIISFEYEVPTLKEWIARIETNTTEYPWLVCEYKNEIIGYAYGSKHRHRTAYSWSPESTVYLSHTFHRLGIAKVLYESLFDLLRLQGYVNVYAGVSMPNINSESFHLALGFTELGVFKKIGFKFGAWHDTKWFQLHLINHPDNPQNPKVLNEVLHTEMFVDIITKANLKLKGLSKESINRG
jgi:phosphinothricin acetyltransferase